MKERKGEKIGTTKKEEDKLDMRNQEMKQREKHRKLKKKKEKGSKVRWRKRINRESEKEKLFFRIEIQYL